METIVARAYPRPHKKTRDEAPGSMSASSFQAWLGRCKELRQNGWDVTVLLAADESHAILLACRQDPAEAAA